MWERACQCLPSNSEIHSLASKHGSSQHRERQIKQRHPKCRTVGPPCSSQKNPPCNSSQNLEFLLSFDLSISLMLPSIQKKPALAPSFAGVFPKSSLLSMD